MKYIPLRIAGLRVMDHIPTRLAFTAIALAIAVFLSGCATAPKAAKAGKLYHVGLVMAERAGQCGASTENYRGGALVRARDSRSAIPLRRPNTAENEFMG